MRKFFRWALVGTAAMCAMVFAPAAASAQPAPENDCARELVLGVDGTLALNSPFSSAYSITSRYRDRPGVEVRHIQYPAEIRPIGAHTYDESKAIGIRELRRVVDEQTARCPDTLIKVIGFSQGAAIAGDYLAEVGRGEHGSPRIQGLLAADPRTPDTGFEVQVHGAIEGLGVTFTGERGGFGDVPVTTICANRDGVCDMVPLDSPPALLADRFFGYLTKHTGYERITVDGRPFVDVAVDLLDNPTGGVLRI